MPELPEAETIRRDLEKFVIGKKIVEVKILHSKTVGNQPDSFIRAFKNRYFSGLNRIGKALIFQISGQENYLIVHLKMTGQLIYQDGSRVAAGGHSGAKVDFELPHQHTRVYFKFEGGGWLFFNDQRLFGYLKLADAAGLKRFAARFGPEPMERCFNAAYLASLFRSRRAPVKAILLDQSLIAGIGNIYADEILFASGVRPDRPASSLVTEEIGAIAKAASRILKLAIRRRGTTFNNYRDGQGNMGSFLSCLQVYHREGQPCFRCGQTRIEKSKVAGRGTHFCSVCQK